MNTTVPTTPAESEPVPPTYPIPFPVRDSRFSLGLIIDVANVLEARGFPPVRSGVDYVALDRALFGFIYRPVSEHLGSADPTGLKFSREAEDPEPGVVADGIEGGSVTGRASVPDMQTRPQCSPECAATAANRDGWHLGDCPVFLAGKQNGGE